jgi:hypothetical protein
MAASAQLPNSALEKFERQLRGAHPAFDMAVLKVRFGCEVARRLAAQDWVPTFASP